MNTEWICDYDGIRVANGKQCPACAFVDDVTVQVGSPEEAAPFVALTTSARGVYRETGR